MAGTSYFGGNGNIIIDGPLSGAASLLKAENSTIISTLWLKGATGLFTGTAQNPAGFIRVSDGKALASYLSKPVVLAGGTLELRLRSGAENSLSSRNLSMGATNSAIFIDKGFNSQGVGGSLFVGSLSSTSAYSPILTVGGRNGIGLSVGNGTLSAPNGAINQVSNVGNGTFEFRGRLEAGNFTISGNGDFYVSDQSMVGFTKTGSGLVAINGSLSGSVSINGGGLEARSISYTGTSPLWNRSVSLSSGLLSLNGILANDVPLLVNLAGNGIVLANQQSADPFVLPVGVAASGSGNKVLLLGGTSSSVNRINGPVHQSGGVTSIFKADVGTWVYAPKTAYDTLSSGSFTVVSSAPAFAGSLVVSSTFGLGIGMSVSGPNVSGQITNITSNNTIWLSSTSTQVVTANTQVTFGSLTHYKGSLSISAGTMRLEALSGMHNLIGDSSAVIFTADNVSPGFGKQNAGGIVEYAAFATTSSEAAGSLSASAGANAVVLTNGGTLSFGSLGARSAGATIDFRPGTGSVTFNSVTQTNGLLGGWATVNGVDFAGTLSNGQVVPATYSAFTNSGGSAAVNYLLDGGTSTLGAVAANALKISAGGTLMLGGSLALASGGLVFDNSSGPMIVTGSTLGGAGAELIVTVAGSSPSSGLTLDSMIGAGAASLTKSGDGLLVISGVNTYTGNTVVNAGSLRLSGTSATLGVPGAATLLTIRQSGRVEVNGAGTPSSLYTDGPTIARLSLGLLHGSGVIDNSSATPVAIAIGSAGASGNAVFSGLISNTGAGSLSVVKAGAAGTQYFTALNTYTGPTILSGATLAVNILTNGGRPSSIGASSSDAANLVFNGGTLRYTGSDSNFVQFTQTPSVSIDRLFTLAANGAIDSSGNYGNNSLTTGVQNNAALVFSNTGTIAFAGTGARTLTLTGNSTGDNEIASKLVDNGTSALSVNKFGTGQWLLTGLNTYSGQTAVTAGVLQAQDGLGLPTSSNLYLNGGVFQSEGVFSRMLGTAAGQIQFGASGGGFAAAGMNLKVNLGGTLVMGTAPFAGSTLFLGATNSPGVALQLKFAGRC
jgi:autotransporter-associated beta strand protein